MFEDWTTEPTVAEAVAAIQALDSTLAPPITPLELPSYRWRPDLVASECVVHVALGSAIPNAYLRRIEAAAGAGMRVHVAVASTLDLPALRRLQAAGVGVIGFETPTVARRYSSIADWIALGQIALDADALRCLGRDLLEVCRTAESSQVRGRAFEEVLCLLFSQVSWLRVTHHGLHNRSEEIDVVMQVTAAGSLAQLAGGPIALATAKNEKTPAGSATVKYLKGQMVNRRQRCKLGFLCAMKDISGKAHEEINRGSETDRLIVPLGGAAVEALLDGAERLDALIEQRIVDATVA